MFAFQKHQKIFEIGNSTRNFKKNRNLLDNKLTNLQKLEVFEKCFGKKLCLSIFMKKF